MRLSAFGITLILALPISAAAAAQSFTLDCQLTDAIETSASFAATQTSSENFTASYRVDPAGPSVTRTQEGHAEYLPGVESLTADQVVFCEVVDGCRLIEQASANAVGRRTLSFTVINLTTGAFSRNLRMSNTGNDNSFVRSIHTTRGTCVRRG